MSPTAETRLLKGLQLGAPSGCWLWSGGQNNNGYGMIFVGPKKNSASSLVHRVAWMLWNGEIPKGLKVLHKCDTPCCCNPGHLFLGDQLANVRDMDGKGRRGTWNPKGEIHHRAKLSEDEVITIKRSTESSRVLSESYRTSMKNIQRIRKGVAWPHLNVEAIG